MSHSGLVVVVMVSYQTWISFAELHGVSTLRNECRPHRPDGHQSLCPSFSAFVSLELVVECSGVDPAILEEASKVRGAGSQCLAGLLRAAVRRQCRPG